MYLFVWKLEDGGDLGEYWKLLVEHLKSPVRHSLEAFVLQEDHDIIRKLFLDQIFWKRVERHSHIHPVTQQAYFAKHFGDLPDGIPREAPFCSLIFGHPRVPTFHTTRMPALHSALKIWHDQLQTGGLLGRSKFRRITGWNS